MARLCSVQPFNLVSKCWLQSVILRLFLLKSLTALNVSLNSCKRCAAGEEYKVTPEVGYSVGISSSADAACWECEARFYSGKNSSWLCLSQVGIQSQIDDSNGQLLVNDNQNIEQPIPSLGNFPSSWQKREYCRKSQSLNFQLKRVRSSVNLDFEKLHIQFQVLDIESKDRILYLDGTYCNTNYKLRNSKISIYNQPEKNEPVTFDETLTSLCGIPVELAEVNEITNKNICILYEPLSHRMDCRSNWKFSVSLAGYSIKPEDMAYTLNCADDKAQEPHTWCAANGTNKVTLVFQRDRNVPKSAELPKMFKYIVLDYNGSVESLRAEMTKLIEEWQKPPEDDASNNGTTIIIISLIVGVVVFLAVITAVVYKRHSLKHCLYTSVHTTENAEKL